MDNWSDLPILYLKFVFLNIKSRTTYSVDHFIGVISNIFIQLTSILIIVSLVDKMSSLAGWTRNEIFILFGYLTFITGIGNVFFSTFYYLPTHYLNTGDFDRLLIQPRPILFMILADRAEIQGISSIFIGIGCFIFGIINSNVVLGYKAFLVPLMIVLSIVANFYFHLLAAALAFKLRKFTGYLDFLYSANDILKYPLSAFPHYISILFKFVFPLAVLGYQPVAYILGKSTLWELISVAISAVVIAILASAYWKEQLKYYSSTGA